MVQLVELVAYFGYVFKLLLEFKFLRELPVNKERRRLRFLKSLESLACFISYVSSDVVSLQTPVRRDHCFSCSDWPELCMTMLSLSVTYSSSIGSGLFVVLVGIKHFQIYILVTIIFDRFCAHTKLATSAKVTSSNKISYCLA